MCFRWCLSFGCFNRWHAFFGMAQQSIKKTSPILSCDKVLPLSKVINLIRNMNYQYHQWRKCHPSQKGEKCKRKWKELKMRGKHWKEWKRHAWGEYKNKNEHIYIASACKVIICPNSRQGTSRGLRGLCICLHIYESGNLRDYSSIMLLSVPCYFIFI